MKSNYKRLGDYIEIVNIKNSDNKVKLLLGVSIEKKFIKSIANTIGTDMKNYQIVKKWQFAYGPVTSRNGDKISVALLTDNDECIISSAYTAFKVIDENELLPEYLMLWLRRPEFDRYARFHSHGSAREIFDWEEMCNVMLPIPDITKQQEIVNAYNTIENRIALKQQINANLEEILENEFVEKIFNNDKYIEEALDDNIDFINGLAMQNYRPTNAEKSISVLKIRELTQGYCDKNSELCTINIDDKNIIYNGDIVFSWSGSLQTKIWVADMAGLNQHLFKVISNKYPKWYIYSCVKFHMQNFQRIAENKGTTFGHIKREDLHNAKIKKISEEDILILNKYFEPILNLTITNNREIYLLSQVKNIILSQISN